MKKREPFPPLEFESLRHSVINEDATETAKTMIEEANAAIASDKKVMDAACTLMTRLLKMQQHLVMGMPFSQMSETWRDEYLKGMAEQNLALEEWIVAGGTLGDED